MEKRLWTGSYYLNYWEPETNRKSDLVFGYQLDGEWITAHHGLPSTLPKNRVRQTLETIKRCNVAVTKYGAVNYAQPDGTPAQVKGYGTYSYFPPEALMLAMNFIVIGIIWVTLLAAATDSAFTGWAHYLTRWAPREA